MINRLLLAIFLLLSFSETAAAASFRRCIGADDFGIGGLVVVYANPLNKSATALMQQTPLINQVMEWTSTDLYTYGIGGDPSCQAGSPNCNAKRGVLKMYVYGAWAPFTYTNSIDLSDMPECKFLPCNPLHDSRANNSECFAGDGKTLDAKADRSNMPCKISAGGCPGLEIGAVCNTDCSGYGLYGLIALNLGGRSDDPNLNVTTSETPSTTSFRTFRVAPLSRTADGRCYAEIYYTNQCTVDPNNPNSQTDNTICLADMNTANINIVPKGKLYFKIEDTHYQDNVGNFTVDVVSGVHTGIGFIEKTVRAFESQMGKVTKGMYENITGQFGFINIVRTLIYFYIVITGLMFIMGNINTTQAELVIRLFKVSLLLILISPTSFEFFNTYLFSFFTDGARDIAKIILDSTLYYNEDLNSPRFAMPEDATALAVYDIIIKMLISQALNAKIWALILTQYCYLVFIFYACIALLLLGTIRAVMIYLTAIMLVAVLLVIAPVFLVMILFQITKPLFENWLNLLISAGMMIVAVSALLALLMTILMNQIEHLFSYEVCEMYLFTIFSESPNWLKFYQVWWWYPRDFQSMQEHISTENVIAFILVSTVFEMVMRQIPEVIDALSESQLMPVRSLASGAADKLFSTARGAAVNARVGVTAGLDVAENVAKGANWATGNRPFFRGVAGLLGARHKIDSIHKATQESWVGKGVDMITSAPDKLDNIVSHDAPLINPHFEHGFKGVKEQLAHASHDLKKEWDAGKTKEKLEEEAKAAIEAEKKKR